MEKNYDLEKFINGKTTKKINEVIENVNIQNFDQKFSNIDIDKKIIIRIKNKLLARASNDIIEVKKLDQKGFIFSMMKIKIENIENNSSVITINGIKITGKLHVIKTYKIINKKPCGGIIEKTEEREGHLNNNESKNISEILSKEIANEFNNLIL